MVIGQRAVDGDYADDETKEVDSNQSKDRNDEEDKSIESWLDEA